MHDAKAILDDVGDGFKLTSRTDDNANKSNDTTTLACTKALVTHTPPCTNLLIVKLFVESAVCLLL
jgi:hypothetical protein